MKTPTPPPEHAKTQAAVEDDLFRSLSPEELARVPRVSKEAIQEALQRGAEARKKAAEFWPVAHYPRFT